MGCGGYCAHGDRMKRDSANVEVSELWNAFRRTFSSGSAAVRSRMELWAARRRTERWERATVRREG